MKYFLCTGLILMLSFASGSSAEEGDPSLKFLVSGRTVNELALSGLKSTLIARKIEFFDPMYGKVKRYEGFSLRDVMRVGFGDKWANPGYPDIVFTALDGYESVSVISKIKEPGGYIVFRDLDEEEWEPVGRREESPGPFYLVWTGKGQTAGSEYPWPWQIASINVLNFRDEYNAVYQEGAEIGSGPYGGYLIFKGRCVRCHSMNGQGGKVGPDLNAPKSIVAYRSPHMIKEFIKNPSEYRYTQMPDHPDLSDTDLDNLLYYFSFMNENRR